MALLNTISKFDPNKRFSEKAQFLDNWKPVDYIEVGEKLIRKIGKGRATPPEIDKIVQDFIQQSRSHNPILRPITPALQTRFEMELRRFGYKPPCARRKPPKWTYSKVLKSEFSRDQVDELKAQFSERPWWRYHLETASFDEEPIDQAKLLNLTREDSTGIEDVDEFFAIFFEAKFKSKISSEEIDTKDEFRRLREKEAKMRRDHWEELMRLMPSEREALLGKHRLVGKREREIISELHEKAKHMLRCRQAHKVEVEPFMRSLNAQYKALLIQNPSYVEVFAR